ncbi:hypothetical protein M422DRAFT_160319, partial [Sphaerobolus stellatus SS14]
MPYATNARFKSGKSCLPGTRSRVQEEIFKWAFNSETSCPIFILKAPAGTGKSAIAHSIAKRCHEMGHLGSAFFFGRGDVTRSIELYFPTLAQDLASGDPQFKQALCTLLDTQDRGLRKTTDLEDQLQNFILTPLEYASRTGPVIII